MDKRRSPNGAVKAFCLDCMNGSRHEVNLCPSHGFPNPKDDCPLWKGRKGKGARLKMIKGFCVNCGAGIGVLGIIAVKKCRFNGVDDIKCALYDFRTGEMPPIRQKRQTEARTAIVPQGTDKIIEGRS